MEGVRELRANEVAAIAKLKAALRRFPKTLRLQAGTGGLNVVMLDPETGDPYYLDGSDRWTHESIVAYINVNAEGGDPW